MKKVLAALQLVLHDLANLQVVTIAGAVAGVLVPIVAKLLGADVTVAEVTGWLVLVGVAAGAFEKVLSGQAAAKVAADQHPDPIVTPPAK